MFNLIKKLFILLTPEQKKSFYVLQVLVILMAIFEVLSIAAISPFMAIVGDNSLLEKDTIVSYLYDISEVSSVTDFIVLMGISVLSMLLVSAIISTYTTWKLSIFATKVGVEISNTLYAYYMKNSWLFHTSTNTAELTKKIANESSRVTSLILQPLVIINAKIILVILLSSSIFIYNPQVAIIGLTVFICAYIFLYKFVRKILYRNGKKISNVLETRYRLMNEGFGGIKDILLHGHNDYFIQEFEKSGAILTKSQSSNMVLAQIPRYFIEFIAFGTIITLIIFLVITYKGDLGLILPTLAVYAIASLKLLPAFQQIYNSSANIKGNISAFESIEHDLSSAIRNQKSIVNSKNKINCNNSIVLKDIIFKYPQKSQLALNRLNMTIYANTTIGVVGSSGSGKSTLVNILLGLLVPNEGSLFVDDIEISKHNLREWQNSIGYVPQDIFLSEGSIAENIAFGISKDKICYDRISQILRLVHLNDFVNSLAQGINEKVGERGIQLSGGQKQRVGIARALYHEVEVLILDEATSSLDGITEAAIMESIQMLAGKKTIIMVAHRLKTIEQCDHVFLMEEGKILDHGKYNDLINRNEKFKRMALHA